MSVSLCQLSWKRLIKTANFVSGSERARPPFFKILFNEEVILDRSMLDLGGERTKINNGQNFLAVIEQISRNSTNYIVVIKDPLPSIFKLKNN